MTKLVDQSGSLIASLPRFQSKTAVRFDRESNVGSLDVPVAFFFFPGGSSEGSWPKTRQGSVHVQLLGIADITLCL